MSLTCRERVLQALEFRSGEDVPVVGGFIRHPAFLADTAGVSVETFWASPRHTAIAAFRRLGVDVIVGLILPDRQSATGSQVDYRQQSDFDSPEAVRDHVLALPSAAEVAAGFDREAARVAYLDEVKQGQADCGDILWVPGGIHRNCPIFDHCLRFGYENYLMALTLYPDAMEALFASDAERAYLTNCVVAEATAKHQLPPIVWTGTDACDNLGPFVDADIMRRIYFPHLKRALAPLCAAGIAVIWHSDGNIGPIAGDLLEAGVEGFQGLQEKVETRVDLSALDRLTTRRGRRPVIMGSVSSVVTMPFGTPQDVRSEVTRLRDFARQRSGGLLLNFSSSLGPEVPEGNIHAFYAAAAGRDG